jgi:hypothetical protein
MHYIALQVVERTYTAIYLLSRWYTKKVKSSLFAVDITEENFQELAFRSAILYTGLLVSNAFGAVSTWCV